MTFPFKKRIKTGLFIDRNKEFIYKTVKLNEEAEQRREIKNGSIKKLASWRRVNLERRE